MVQLLFLLEHAHLGLALGALDGLVLVELALAEVDLLEIGGEIRKISLVALLVLIGVLGVLEHFVLDHFAVEHKHGSKLGPVLLVPLAVHAEERETAGTVQNGVSLGFVEPALVGFSAGCGRLSCGGCLRFDGTGQFGRLQAPVTR